MKLDWTQPLFTEKGRRVTLIESGLLGTYPRACVIHYPQGRQLEQYREDGTPKTGTYRLVNRIPFDCDKPFFLTRNGKIFPVLTTVKFSEGTSFCCAAVFVNSAGNEIAVNVNRLGETNITGLIAQNYVADEKVPSPSKAAPNTEAKVQTVSRFGPNRVEERTTPMLLVNVRTKTRRVVFSPHGVQSGELVVSRAMSVQRFVIGEGLQDHEVDYLKIAGILDPNGTLTDEYSKYSPI